MTIKKELILGLLFLMLVLGIIFIPRILKQSEKEMKTESVLQRNTLNSRTDSNLGPAVSGDPNQPTSSPNGQSEYTLAEVSSHNTPEDCWVAINGQIYDISGFNVKHPGGTGPIEFNCGKNATQAFTTRMGKGPHPDTALVYLNQYLVGVVSE